MNFLLQYWLTGSDHFHSDHWQHAFIVFAAYWGVGSFSGVLTFGFPETLCWSMLVIFPHSDCVWWASPQWMHSSDLCSWPKAWKSLLGLSCFRFSCFFSTVFISTGFLLTRLRQLIKIPPFPVWVSSHEVPTDARQFIQDHGYSSVDLL